MALRIITALLLVLGLSGCFYLPNNYTAVVDLRRDGSFTLRYQGEIVVRAPPGNGSAASRKWDNAMVVCTDDSVRLDEDRAREAQSDRSEPADGERPCTAAEIAAQRKQFESDARKRAEEERKNGEGFARAFGIPGNRATDAAFAAELMKYRGWKSVQYKGEGVFAVTYEAAGRLDQDTAFPVFPRGAVIFPFIVLQRRADGAVLVTGPGFAMSGLAALGNPGMPRIMGDDVLPPDGADGKGTFSIVTDGEILTNNTADGPTNVPGGRQLQWTFPASGRDKPPEALIRLN